MILHAGDPAPDFDLPTADQGRCRFSAFGGARVVLFFYPKAGTSGCTEEARAFQRMLPEFVAYRVNVIGISRDPPRALEKFAAQHELRFPLASDADGQVATRYGVWVERSMYGRRYMGMERTTFLIGPQGRIARIWPKVNVVGHAASVLASVSAPD